MVDDRVSYQVVMVSTGVSVATYDDVDDATGAVLAINERLGRVAVCLDTALDNPYHRDESVLAGLVRRVQAADTVKLVSMDMVRTVLEACGLAADYGRTLDKTD